MTYLTDAREILDEIYRFGDDPSYEYVEHVIYRRIDALIARVAAETRESVLAEAAEAIRATPWEQSAVVAKVGSGWAVCYVARCIRCGWQHAGSTKRRSTARDWAVAHRCPAARRLRGAE